VQVEGGNSPQRDRGDDSKAADADARGAQRVGIIMLAHLDDRSVGQHELNRNDPRGNVLMSDPRSVGYGRCGSGQRLDIDVAKVRECQSLAVESLAQRSQGDACFYARES
jgi:hypothetical protein